MVLIFNSSGVFCCFCYEIYVKNVAIFTSPRAFVISALSLERPMILFCRFCYLDQFLQRNASNLFSVCVCVECCATLLGFV